MISSPFKFLDSYTKDDASIFFGREKETEELYRKIFENKTLLVYGVSGTGKTSIINCGLANKFNDADWLPVTIRRNQNMVESFYAALNKLSPDTKDKGKRDAKAFIKLLQSVYLDHFKPVYLLFDQFEELFIFGDEEEQKAFVDIIAQIKASDVQVKILFIMREEYLANMSAFEEKIPDLLTNRLRIEKMSTAKVKEAITGPCNYAGIAIENEAVETIIEKLTRQGKTIELTYLQVLLDRLFHKATQEQKSDNLQFTQSLVESLGEVSDILGDFLEEQIRLFDNPDQVLDVLKSFVSIRGTKRQSTVEEIGNHLRSLNKAQESDTLQTTIQQLVNLRILREKDENDRYELRHDALAMKIYEKVTLVEKELLEVRDFLENALNNFQKRRRLLSVEDLKYIAPYEEKMFLSADTAKLLERSKLELTREKRRRRRIIGSIAVVVIIVLSIFFVWAINERNNAIEKEVMANIEKNRALRAITRADMAKEKANVAMQEADSLRKLKGRMPTAVISALKMNVLYYGIENPIAASVPGFKSENIRVTATNASAHPGTEPGIINVKPRSSGGTVIFSIYVLKYNEWKFVGKKTFRVKTIPEPVAAIGGKNGGDISVGEIEKSKGIIVVNEDFDYDLQYEVTGFKLFYIDSGGFYVEEESKSNQFTKNQISMLENLRYNTRFFIIDINAIGDDGKERIIDGLIFRVR